MTVRFDHMDDFVVELERDAKDDAIDHKIVRMAPAAVTKYNAAGVPLLTTIVGYQARGQTVELTAAAGWLWTMSAIDAEDADQPKRELAKTTAQAIRDLCAQHGLDLRQGRFV